MEKDELLKRVLMMQRLQGMETEPISAEDPYASMEKNQGDRNFYTRFYVPEKCV